MRNVKNHFANAKKEKIIVDTLYGKVAGYLCDGIYVWKGIPYAKAPKGELRFNAPQQPERFKGVYNATKFKPVCPQMIRFQKEKENENCLNLNVYSPSITVKKPVMLFLHGGAFIAGSGSQYLYNGTNIAQKDVVVVTINYRLGALGMFNFSFLDEKFVTNIALRDQLAALEWVYDNISAFGGDREDITVCGQSAGAISVICLLNIPSAKKYIKKAVAISPLPDILNSKERSIEIAKGFLKWLNIEESKAKECLMNISTRELNKLARAYTKTYERKNGLDVLMPVIDGQLLPERPLSSVKNGNSNYIPLLIGITKNEVDIVFKLKNYKDMAQNELSYFFDDEKEIEEEIVKAYGEKDFMKIYPIIGRDWLVKIPSEWYAEFHTDHADVWLYRFDYENLFLKLTGLHTAHTLDLIFAFKNFDNMVGKLLFSLTPFRRKAYELADRLGDDLVNFIKSGKAPWERFNNGNAVKIYNKDGDNIETAEKDSIRQIWQKTNLYKNI